MKSPSLPDGDQTHLDLASAARQMGQRRFKTGRVILALILREMSTTYGKSPGGYIWAVLEPLGAILIMTIVFSFVMRTPPLGTTFIMFYATGYLPFAMYSSLAQQLSASLRFSRPLLAYPAVTYTDAILARALLQILTHAMVFYIVMTGVLTVFDTHAYVDVPSIVLAMAMTAVLGVGIGTMNCFLASVLPVWTSVWAIMTRPMLILSGVLLLYDDLPRTARDILWYNPVVHCIGMMRRGFYASYDASYASPAYVFGVGLVLLALGLVFLARYHRMILNET